MMMTFSKILIASFFTASFLLAANPVFSKQDYLASAQQAESRGNIKAAIIELKNALQQDPENGKARFMLGSLYLKAGDPASAEKELRRAELLGFQSDELATKIMDTLLSQGKNTELASYLDSHKVTAPVQQATFDAYRGFLKLFDNKKEDARLLFESALKTDPGNVRANLGMAGYFSALQDYASAISQLDQLLSSKPDEIRARVMRGELFRKQGKLDQAAADFAHVLKLNPDHYKARLGTVFVNLAKKQPDQALAEIGKLPASLKKLPLVEYLQAVTYFQKKDLVKTEEHIQQVLSRAPGHLQSLLLAGVVNYSNGKWQLAEEYLSRVHKKLPNNQAVAKLLAAADIKLKNADEALKILQPFGSESKDAQLLSLLGSAYLLKGDNNKAQEWFAKAVEQQPDQAGIRTQLALGMLASGQTDSAISALESAVNLGQDLIQADVLLVMSHLKKGDIKEAIEISGKLANKYPDNPIPYNLTGLAYLAGREFEQAEKQFKKALDTDPQFLIAKINLARAKVAAGKPSEAEGIFKSILTNDPGNATALLGLARLAGQQGNQQARLDYLEQLLDKQPQNLSAITVLAEEHLKRNEPLKALTLLSGVASEQLKHPAVLRLQGMAQIASGEANSAIRTFQQLLKQLPDNVETSFQLGRAYLANKNIDEAARYFTTATTHDPEIRIPLVWLSLAKTRLQQKEFEHVVDLTKRILDKHPGLAEAYEIQAVAYQNLKQKEDMLRSYEMAVEKQPTSKRVNVLANLYTASGQVDKAIRLLSDWVNSHPGDATSNAVLGLVSQQAGNVDLAMKAYTQSLKVNDKNPVIMNNLAWLYHQQGDSRALKLAEKAYNLANKRPEIVDTYGWILYESGQVQKALPILQQALLQNPAHPEIAYHVGLVLHKLGRNAEAAPILERLIRTSPTTTFATQAKALLSKM